MLYLFNLSNGCEVEGKFFFSVNTQKAIHQLLIIRGNSAGAGMDRLARGIEVLAYMSGIKGDYLVCSDVISPLHPIGHGSPYERYS